MKSEADFVSVALGGNVETWTYLKDKVQKIRLHPSDAKGPADFAADKKRKGCPERTQVSAEPWMCPAPE